MSGRKVTEDDKKYERIVKPHKPEEFTPFRDKKGPRLADHRREARGEPQMEYCSPPPEKTSRVDSPSKLRAQWSKEIRARERENNSPSITV